MIISKFLKTASHKWKQHPWTGYVSVVRMQWSNNGSKLRRQPWCMRGSGGHHFQYSGNILAYNKSNMLVVPGCVNSQAKHDQSTRELRKLTVTLFQDSMIWKIRTGLIHIIYSHSKNIGTTPPPTFLLKNTI